MRLADLEVGAVVEVWLPYGAGEAWGGILDLNASYDAADRPYPGTASDNTVRVQWIEDGSFSVRVNERMRVRPRDIQRIVAPAHTEEKGEGRG